MMATALLSKVMVQSEPRIVCWVAYIFWKYLLISFSFIPFFWLSAKSLVLLTSIILQDPSTTLPLHQDDIAFVSTSHSALSLGMVFVLGPISRVPGHLLPIPVFYLLSNSILWDHRCIVFRRKVWDVCRRSHYQDPFPPHRRHCRLALCSRSPRHLAIDEQMIATKSKKVGFKISVKQKLTFFVACWVYSVHLQVSSRLGKPLPSDCFWPFPWRHIKARFQQSR
mgnify:CR=1 FL=1